jgi:Zn-dependent metalloprotease
MRLLSFLLALFISINGLIAQTYYGRAAGEIIDGAAVVRMDQSGNTPVYIEFKGGHEIDWNNFGTWLHKTFELPENSGYQEVNRINDRLGYTHIRFRQTVNNIPVFDGVFIVHIRNNKVVSINGDIYSGAVKNYQKNLSEAQALQFALNKVGAQTYKWQVPSEERWIKEYSGAQDATFYPKGELQIIRKRTADKTFRLAYKFDVYAHQPMSRADIYVDAQNGEILLVNNKIHHQDSLGTAVTKYSGNKPITTDFSNSVFRLRESGRGNGVETYDLNNGTSYGAAVDFIDSNNYWNNVNPQQDEIATDAHWAMEMTYDYFLYKHNRNSIDGNGYKLKGYVHFSNNYANAFWNGQVMSFGDGNSTIGPLVSIDIVGHEISHGLTANTANLVYQDEPGAMNEAYSDIFGTAIEHYGKTGNWTMGEDINYIIRDMSNPKSKGDPDTYHGQYYYIGTADNGGVHTNSGVLNHWFYLTCEGGSGINDNQDTFQVAGVGIDTAAAIAFRTLTVYLNVNSQYADARFYSIKSAMDLYGPCSPAVAAVTNAFYAVGIGNAYVPGVHADFETSITEFCSPPANVQFVNNSSNGINFFWDFGDGTTSTAYEPTHTYTNYGNYAVKLKTLGGSCGSDSIIKIDYISVDTANPCLVFMPPAGSQTLNACKGILFDDGGTGDYSNNTQVTTTIAPLGASSIKLTFTAFDFEAGYDYLKIYNGPNTSAPLIGSYDGNTLPNGGVVIANSGSVTIEQVTDVAVTKSGFVASWQCTMPAIPPVADFTAVDTLSCSGSVSFHDNSANGPSSWYWEFGDGTTANVRNPVHTYAKNGTYSVKLTVNNAYGSNSITKQSYITISKPFSPNAPDKGICNSGSMTLNATASGTINWYSAQTGGTLLHTGPAYTTPNLSSSATYWVENVVSKPEKSAGKPDKTGPGSILNYSQSLIFDVYKPIILDSVTIYTTSAGTRTITLKYANGNVLATKSVNVIYGTNTVYLGFEIPAGNDYRLEGKNLFRNNAGVNYPYVVNGLLSIKRSSASTNPLQYYYYFYDWKIREPDCKSDRVPVHAYINSSNPVADFTITNNDPYIDLNDNTTNPGANTWDFGDGKTSNIGNPSHLYLQNGTYTITLNVDNGCGTDSISKTVTIGQATGIKTAEDDSNIGLYPNPTGGIAYIDLNDARNFDRLSIYDFTGKQVQEMKLNFNTKLVKINLAGMSNGIYLIRLYSDNDYKELKLILNKE